MPIDNQLDMQALARMKTYGGKGILAELLAIYTRDMPIRFEKAKAALADQRAGEIAELLHAMRSSAGNLGVTAIVEESRNLEEQARHGQLETMADQLEQLEEVYLQSVDMLTKVKL